MASRSSSTPSEGEIVESDSEKATTRGDNVRGMSVDRHSRNLASVSRSPSPIPSPRPRRSRTKSRSPYRENRGAKRPRADDEHRDRSRNDPRRFKIRYEDRPFEDRRRIQSTYEDLDRSSGPGPRLRYDDHRTGGRSRDKRRRTRSRSPRPFTSAKQQSQYMRSGRKDQLDSWGWGDHNGREHKESRSRFSNEQSVSDRGHSSVATASAKQDAETPIIQSNYTSSSGSGPGSGSHIAAAEYVPLCERV